MYELQGLFDDLNVFFRDLRASDNHYCNLGQNRLSVPANIYADDEKMNIEIAIVGAKAEDISVKKVESDVIRIKYNKGQHEDDSSRHYFSKTISKKDIDLQLKIDTKYDIDKIEPKYSAGLLTIVVPLSEGAEQKEFKVS
jgi:HSP20 family molecular chaperone IbpA